MPDFFSTGSQRIAYRNNSFQTGLTVTMDVYKPDSTWDNGNGLTELISGLYYIDYNFPVTGTYITNFYEGATQTAAQTYRVFSITATGGSGASAAELWSYPTRTITSGSTTPKQIWEYINRTLTTGASSEETSYISSQVSYISSQLPNIGGGGGGGKGTYIVPATKKSPWTYRQKDQLIDKVNDIFDMVKDVKEKVDESDEKHTAKSDELQKATDINLGKLEETAKSIKLMLDDKANQDKNINSINIEISHLTSQLQDMKSELTDKTEIERVSKQIDSLCNMLAKSLSDDELEKLLKDFK